MLHFEDVALARSSALKACFFRTLLDETSAPNEGKWVVGSYWVRNGCCSLHHCQETI